MPKCFNIIGLAMVSMALVLQGAPAALADDESFIRDTRALGFDFNDQNLISMGRSACYFLKRNRDPGQVTERIMRYGVVDVNTANRFLVRSVAEYCPEFAN